MNFGKTQLFVSNCFSGIKRESAEELEFADYNLFEDPDKTFDTFNTVYDRTKFDRLTKLTEFNTKLNAELIMDTIKRVIRVRHLKKLVQITLFGQIT